MDLLKRALEAKKQQVNEVVAGKTKRFMSRAEWQQQIQNNNSNNSSSSSNSKSKQETQEDMNADESGTSSNKKRLRTDATENDNVERNTKTMKAPDGTSTQATSDAANESSSAFVQNNIDIQEVKRRLRAMGEPISLFGETYKTRLDRLRQIELRIQEKEGSNAGTENALRNILEQEVADEIRLATERAIEQERSGDVDQKAEKEKEKVSKYDFPKFRDQFDRAEDYCFHFIKWVLRMWEKDLHARSNDEKRSRRGQMDSANQKQTRHNLKPLLKMLKSRTVSEDLLKGMELVVRACEGYDYIAANEHYLMIAIGNAAWPIGVTMVGIHERSGREKIFSQHVAHVLNDEVTRKYIQAIKRLVTYHQARYAHTAPLRSS